MSNVEPSANNGSDRSGLYDLEVNVLLVDDQPAKLLTYGAILGGVGANLITANSAREALDCLLKKEIALVLIDVCMPELDGFELAEMIRQHPRYQKTAIIFVSAVNLSDFDRLRGYEYGAIDYVPVPVMPEILRAKVNVFLDLYRKTRELEVLNQDLEARVALRTAALQEADERKNEFLAMLGHELRNPLGAIRTAAQIIGMRQITADQRENSAAVIRRQVEHLVRLVDDLLDVSRITRGTIAIRREPTLVSDIVAQAVETTRPSFDGRNQVLAVESGAEQFIVNGDGSRLAQVLGNVINNAAKFTPEGGRIHVDVSRVGDEVAIRVIDTGVGVPPEQLETIFDLFTQVGRPGDRSSGGLGIGLALVKRIVEMHDGHVAALSEGDGKGTQIVINLPLYTEPPIPVPLPESNAAGADRALSPSRILVVEDNKDVAATMAVRLEVAGHKVRVANSGPEAIRIGPEFNPEFVILDIGMPTMDGYDTARNIREAAWGRDATLVALTGWGHQEERDRTAAAGFDAHLVKPVGEELFLELARIRRPNAPRKSTPLESAEV
jgi:signal transduction histidine kinase